MPSVLFVNDMTLITAKCQVPVRFLKGQPILEPGRVSEAPVHFSMILEH